MANKPDWLVKALSYRGIRETKGAKHTAQILRWWTKLKSAFRDDETPWCAAFVGGVLEECGILSTRSAAARSYQRWGVKLDAPAVGAVVVFWRKSPNSASGHVGFIVGKDAAGNLLVVGGNQGDEVSVKSFAKSRVISYHWPKTRELPQGTGEKSLPVLASVGDLSAKEA